MSDWAHEQLLADALRVLEGLGIAHALIGGGARNAYAEPRATRDVDFVVEVDPEQLRALERALAHAGFRPATRVGGDEAVPDLVLYRDSAGRRIDVLFAHTDFERSALERAIVKPAQRDRDARVVSPEDLIVYKILADRPQDRVDVIDVVRAVETSGGSIDWAYVERWCDAWEVTQRLTRIREELAR